VRFTYSPDALDNPSVYPISLSLPKRVEPYPDSKAGPFFRNLLPEQAYKRLVAATVGVAPENDLALLGAIGGECPGAVSIWPKGERPASPPKYRSVSEDGLVRLFAGDNRQEMATALTRGRLSLAGAQEKIALYRDASGWWIPLNGAITSHILKQSQVEFGHLLENELFCLSLADAIDLGAVSIRLASERVRVLTSERFDRPQRDGTLIRLHQEDFCQVFGVDPSRKYEHYGGPGFKRCASAILSYSAAPIVDLDRLVRWVGFNFLIGNEDAHAKNVALLHGPEGTRLAPFYDIVSTAVYQGLERRLSMKIGHAWYPRNVQATDWQRFARAVDLPWPAVKESLTDMTERVSARLNEVQQSAVAQHGDTPVYRSIVNVIEDRQTQLNREMSKRGRK
jgi:serine/threonine-protein kinase HipA